jgi:hypothetical protein
MAGPTPRTPRPKPKPPVEARADDAAVSVDRQPTREDAARAFGISSDQVFAFRLHDDRLTVVTVDGRKLHLHKPD